MRLVLALVAVLALGTVSLANDVTVLPGEMTIQANGTYLSSVDGLYYTRVWTAGTSYTYCGSCYTTGGYWSYIPLPATTTYSQQSLSLDDPYFESRIADILVLQEKRRGQAQRASERLELVQQLGLQNWLQPALASPLRYPAGATYPGTYGSPFLGKYGSNGNTVYGSGTGTHSIVVDAYGTTNLDLGLQNSAALAQTGLTGYNTALGKGLDGQAAVARIQAAAQGMAALMQAAADPPHTNISSTVTGLTNPQQPTLAVRSGNQLVTSTTAPKLQAQAQDRRAQFIAACIQCHGDQNPKGSYRVKDHWKLTEEQQMAVVNEYLLTDDVNKRMPKGGSPLSTELILEAMPPKQRVEAVKFLLGK